MRSLPVDPLDMPVVTVDSIKANNPLYGVSLQHWVVRPDIRMFDTMICIVENALAWLYLKIDYHASSEPQSHLSYGHEMAVDLRAICTR